jgi:hypothetical protein
VMLTLDNTGRFFSWTYTLDRFTGFGWFHPTDKSADLNLNFHFSPITRGPAGRAEQIFPGATTVEPPSPLLDPEYLKQVREASSAVAKLRDLAPKPCQQSTTTRGTSSYSYPPQEPPGGGFAGGEVSCTTLEYGVAGAGAGLLLRHATERSTVSAISRGGRAPISSSHVALSPSRQELYVLVSNEDRSGVKTLSIVGLRVATMTWLPIRVEVGLAAETTPPSITVFALGGSTACATELSACVLNGSNVRIYSLRSGAVLGSVTSSVGPWDWMDFYGATLSLAVSSSERNSVNLFQFASAD